MHPDTQNFKRIRIYRGKEYVLSPAHPAASAFPLLDEEGIQALSDDIASNGQQEDIIRLPNGPIVDGCNREWACLIAGVEPRYRECHLDDAEILALVVSRNVHRRHLEPSQRAMVAAELAKLTPGSNQHKNKAVEVVTQITTTTTQGHVAEQMDVSRELVNRAVSIAKNAPELVEVVKEGKLDVKTAAKVAKLPPAKRRKIATAANPKLEAKKQLPKAETEPAGPQEECRPEEPPPTILAFPAVTNLEEPDGSAAAVELLCRDLDKVTARMRELKADPRAYSVHWDSAIAQVEAARKTCWQGRPAFPCPYCAANGENANCTACKGIHWVKKSTHDNGLKAVGGAS